MIKNATVRVVIPTDRYGDNDYDDVKNRTDGRERWWGVIYPRWITVDLSIGEGEIVNGA